MRGLALATLLLPAAASATPFPATWLPRHGDGYLVPDTWAARGLRYGRPELIGLVERAAARVAAEQRGALLYVGDLSLQSGARTQWHKSHRVGRDADLIFYALQENGDPVGPPEMMVPFDDGGEAHLSDGSTIRFDTARNWSLVRALLEDDGARIETIFVSKGLRRQLLTYAIGIEERPALIARAVMLLNEPTDSLAHDDHFHVRIFGPGGPAVPEPRPKAFARNAKTVKVRPVAASAAKHPRGPVRAPAKIVKRPAKRR